VIGRPVPATLTRIHTVRYVLLHLGRIQRRQRDAIGAMVRDETSPFSEPVKLYLRDAHDHALQTLDAIETYREMAMGLMDVYLSTTSNRLNEIMKTLTVMASIFIPLTFIVGVYGMNFEYMPELQMRYAYPTVWVVMLGIAFGLLVWFRWRGWIGR
jgi:magnesium transporter